MCAGRVRSVPSLPLREPFAIVGRTSPAIGQRAYSSGTFNHYFLLFYANDISLVLPISQFSYGSGSFERVFASTSNLWYVDKTDYIPKLEALNASAIVSLRPKRMGKTLLKDTLCPLLRRSAKGSVQAALRSLGDWKGPNPTPTPSTSSR